MALTFTYSNNTVGSLNAYGYGDTRNGVTPIPYFNSFPEYVVQVRSTSFYITTGDFYVPIFQADLPGYYITYLPSGWNYVRRINGRPLFAPKRRDFFQINGIGSDVQTLDNAFIHFNYPGENGRQSQYEGVIKVYAVGCTSSYRMSPYSGEITTPGDILVSQQGEFVVEQYTYAHQDLSSIPSGYRQNYFNGIQNCSCIRFFTEDNFGIIVLDLPQDIRTKLNKRIRTY